MELALITVKVKQDRLAAAAGAFPARPAGREIIDLTRSGRVCEHLLSVGRLSSAIIGLWMWGGADVPVEASAVLRGFWL